LNHCKEMGAEPGRQSLKMPAEKLGPVIVPHDNFSLLTPHFMILPQLFVCN